MTDFVRKDVELPSDIVDFFASVWEMIESREDSAMTESDDLLQSERIYGGLTDRRRKIYSFTWFPESVPSERWEMQLFADEIDEIGSGYRKKQRVKAYARSR
jgi:hypothetical protein